jgi:hypothetical protein
MRTESSLQTLSFDIVALIALGLWLRCDYTQVYILTVTDNAQWKPNAAPLDAMVLVRREIMGAGRSYTGRSYSVLAVALSQGSRSTGNMMCLAMDNRRYGTVIVS